MTEEVKLRAIGDASKCAGVGCELANTCTRYLRPSAERQVWTAFDSAPKPCENYISIESLK